MAQDPFRVPPNEYDMSILKAVEPFLCVHQNPSALRISGLDKFEGGKMKADCLHAFLHLMGREVADIERKYDEQRTELNFHPRDLDLIGLIEPFTTPTETECEYEFLRKYAFWDVQDEDDEQSGLCVVAGLEDFVDGPSSSSNALQDGLSPPSSENDDNEEMKPPQGPNNVRQKGRTDGRVLIHDKHPLRRTDLSDSIKAELLTQRCAIVKEFKASEDSEAIMQCTAYSRSEILRNISNHHYKPMCVLVFSKFKFTYAFVRYEGKIRASGDKVSEDAYEGFRQSCRDPAKQTSLHELNARYKARLQHLQSVYKPTACYKQRDYIVGDLYMAPEWYALPTTKTESGMVSTGSKKFFEGLLRVIIGDVVLKWQVADLLQARTRRMVQSTLQAGTGGLGAVYVSRLNMLLNASAIGCM